MRFTIEQHFAAAPDLVLAAFTDPALYPTLTGLSKIDTPDVIDRRQQGDQVELRLRMRFIADLSSAARAVVDPAKLTWVQDEHYDLAARRASVRFLPDNYVDRFTCDGEYAFLDNGHGGTVVRTEGDLRIRVPLVGGQVERALVSGLREHYAELQPRIERWMHQH